MVWRLGIPAVLMLAFALIGLTTAPWRDDAVAPPTGAGSTAPAEAPRITRPTVKASAVVEDNTEAGSGPAQRGREVAEAPDRPTLRLPEELEPEAPDVVVAMPWPPIAVPLSWAERLAEETVAAVARAPHALAAATGDDFQGPEPGARYWFGPHGLERVEVVGEARR